MERELEALSSALLRGDPLVLILGLRKPGKNSLLLTGLGESKRPAIIVDLRAIGVKPYATKKDLIQLLEASVNKFLLEQEGQAGKIIDRLRGVKGVQVMGTRVTFSWIGKETFQVVDLFNLLDDAAARNKQRVVFAFDEAQELAKVVWFEMQKVLAHVFDYCKNTTIVLTGSAIGLLRDFVAVDEPNAPLYGRAMTEIVLGRLNEAQAADFLAKGFKQSGLREDERVVGEALEELDGIIGWLTMFGSVCIKEGVSKSAVGKVREVGRTMAKREFQTFLGPRQIASRRYTRIMKHLGGGPSSWSALKRSVESLEGRTINDKSITGLITTLVKARRKTGRKLLDWRPFTQGRLPIVLGAPEATEELRG